LCQPNALERATVLMTSLTGCFVVKLTFALKTEASKPVGFTQNNVAFIIQIMMHK